MLPRREARRRCASANLQITHADGNIVIADANTEIAKGERVLIVGAVAAAARARCSAPSPGCGRGARARSSLPDRSQMMFMPQRPYLPLGTLRQAVAYPAPARRVSGRGGEGGAAALRPRASARPPGRAGALGPGPQRRRAAAPRLCPAAAAQAATGCSWTRRPRRSTRRSRNR